MAIFEREPSREVAIEERIAAADALGQSGDPRLNMNREDYWADIPGGSFLMGAQKKDKRQPNYDPEADDESPVHEVSLDGYRIARYPITVGQYEHFLNDEGYQCPRGWGSGGFGEYTKPEDWEEQIEYPSRPVVSVSWWEAAAFCAWSGYRLPTEAEWEFAARGTEGRKYPWGNEKPDASRMNNYNVGHVTPVGIFPGDLTLEGVLDRGGNVREWCWDGYERYRGESVKNPRGADEASTRVYRGGSWYAVARSCRSAYRPRFTPGSRHDSLGFRLAFSSVE